MAIISDINGNLVAVTDIFQTRGAEFFPTFDQGGGTVVSFADGLLDVASVEEAVATPELELAVSDLEVPIAVNEDAAIFEGSTVGADVATGNIASGLIIERLNLSPIGLSAASAAYRPSHALPTETEEEETHALLSIQPTQAVVETQQFERQSDRHKQRVTPIWRTRARNYRSPYTAQEPATVSALEVMSSPIVGILETETVRDVQTRFLREDLSNAPVVSKTGKLVGMLASADVFGEHSEPSKSSSGDRRVRDVMSEVLLKAQLDSSVQYIARKMFEKRLDAVPVVDERDQLLGVLTRSDVIGSLAGHSAVEIWT